MQKVIKLMSVPWWQIVRNGHIITSVFTLLTSKEDKRMLYKYSSESINMSLLQDDFEIQELRLQIDGKHEGDCKKSGKTSKAG